MPNLKSSKKQAKQAEKHRLINYARKSDVKTAVKKVMDAVAAKDLDQAREMLRLAQAKLARARSKGLYHRNTVARKMSRLAQKVKELAV